MTVIHREGVDHDPVRPWVWATMIGRRKPVEIVSYPIPHAEAAGQIDSRATIMVRMFVGCPLSIREVPFDAVACFEPDRHEDFYRPRLYDDGHAFMFADLTADELDEQERFIEKNGDYYASLYGV